MTRVPVAGGGWLGLHSWVLIYELLVGMPGPSHLPLHLTHGVPTALAILAGLGPSPWLHLAFVPRTCLHLTRSSSSNDLF